MHYHTSGLVEVSCESHSVEYIVVDKLCFFPILIGGFPGSTEILPNTTSTSESDAATTCDFVGPDAKQAIAVQHNDVEGISKI